VKRLAHNIYIHKKIFYLDLLLVVFAFFYYLYFTNKGIVLGDEGYYVHYAERIAHGELAYKDFLLQYTPGFFYLLAGLYKIFGVQILVGRFVSMTFSLLTLVSVLYLLYVHRIQSLKIHIVTGLMIILLGYPLLHIPLVIWSAIFLSVAITIIYTFWYRSRVSGYLVLLGILLALTLFFRQHLGIVFLLVINGLVLACKEKLFIRRVRSLMIINGVWAICTGIWIYFFFIYTHNFSGLLALYTYNKQFIGTFPFSYPPLTFLLQPTGIFKLLPYYYPIIFACLVAYSVYKKKFTWDKLSFVVMALSGFAATVYPASDLLHVYPFLGLVISSSIIFYEQKKGFILIECVAIIFILLGFYLTFFTKSFRYEDYFLKETTPLHLPKTKNIVIDRTNNTWPSLIPLSQFINKNTKKNDYIFVYPFAPLLYVLLDRQNPSGIAQFTLLEAPDSLYSETRVLNEIKSHRVKYIIAVGAYKYKRILSKFIQQQKVVLRTGPYVVFELY
jgi:hypothetical protein